MPQIIQEQPSFAQALSQQFRQDLQGSGKGLAEALMQRKSNQVQQQQQQATNQRYSELTGQDLSGLPPEAQQQIAMQLMKMQESQQANQMKQQEAVAPLQAGLQTIQQMRKLGEGGNLGVIGGFSKEYRRDRAEYEQLGKSLISLASTIPIRNQKEFETLSSKLYDPALTDATREGILNAMERIIQQSMAQYQQHPLMRGEQQMQQQAAPQQKKPLSSFG